MGRLELLKTLLALNRFRGRQSSPNVFVNFPKGEFSSRYCLVFLRCFTALSIGAGFGQPCKTSGVHFCIVDVFFL